MSLITFSDEMKSRINADFDEATKYFGGCREEIQKRTDELDGVEKLFTKYLYAHLPLSDVGAVSFDIIYSYAKHGAFLLENSEFLKGVSAEYFLQYVLACRINSEDLTDCREFFYNMVKDRVKGMNRHDAVLEANNWCYEQATYRSTSP
ncbi:MAG: hypothetical protein K6B75_04195, partial [Lachnospiraceae bacterium]|nr:hypothetical protein [Lachnospiraceae bacterium]